MLRPAARSVQLKDAALVGKSELHQYACMRCRSRRVKCDKILSGCANCSVSGSQCIYSARRPRRTQKSIMKETTTQKTILPAPPSTTSSAEIFTTPNDTSPAGMTSTSWPGMSYLGSDSDDDDYNSLPQEIRSATTSKVRDCIKGCSILLSTSHDGRDLSAFFPLPGMIQLLWDYYCKHVDVMLKVLYKPSVDTMVMRASTAPSCLDTASELPLLFAICLASLTSMSADECQQHHGEDQKTLTRKYRHALEQALLKARWMNVQSIQTLQSLSLYLAFASHHSRATWMVNGIALGLAQTMGLHSEKCNLGFSLAEIEVNRRVWWTLCQLDVRISENCSLQPHVPVETDAQLPTNLNDSDLTLVDSPNVVPRNEFTEMTPTLAKIEMAKTILQFKWSKLDQVKQEKIIRDQIQRYQKIYLNYFELEHDLHRLYYFGTRLLMSRLWKMSYNSDPRLIKDSKNALIQYNIDVLDLAHQLPCRYRKHGWFFRCKSQWHALVYLLNHLCIQPEGHAVPRAWEVIDAVFADWLGDDAPPSLENKTSAMPIESRYQPSKTVRAAWKPLLRLREKALEAQKRTHSLDASVLSSTSSKIGTDTGYETNTILGTEDVSGRLPVQDRVEDDPFFGSVEDLNMEMNWEQIDAWVDNFQAALHESDPIAQSRDMIRTLNWW